MSRRRFWSMNQTANYLAVSREAVLLLELDEDEFPEHIIGDEDRVFWDADEIEEWAEGNDWFEDDEFTESENA